MKVQDKLYMEKMDLIKHGPITIVAFGASFTHGAVGLGEIDYESVYWNRLRKKLNAVRNYVPINIINAGIGGVTATQSLERMDSQVLIHRPDLIIVDFALNDVNDPLQQYLASLRLIFEKSIESGAQVIFMTPSMMNTYVGDAVPDSLRDYAFITAEYQNSGKVDLYLQKACLLAEEMQVSVCDCYSKWKKMSETQDTTKLLANGINHPIREMHQMFADSLFDVIMQNEIKEIEKEQLDDNTMYEK